MSGCWGLSCNPVPPSPVCPCSDMALRRRVWCHSNAATIGGPWWPFCRNVDGQTALMFAAINRKETIIRLLLNRGALPNIKVRRTPWSPPPLHPIRGRECVLGTIRAFPATTNGCAGC